MADCEHAKLEDDDAFLESEDLGKQIHVFPGVNPYVTCTAYGLLFSEVRAARAEQLKILEEKARKFI
jgi:hypothetical protein